MDYKVTRKSSKHTTAIVHLDRMICDRCKKEIKSKRPYGFWIYANILSGFICFKCWKDYEELQEIGEQ